MTHSVLGKERVEEFVGRACREVEKNDNFLLAEDVSEWAVAHRLAVYLEKYFSDYSVDCEYNRMAGPDGLYTPRSPKKVHGSNKQRPDIIIHRRGPETLGNLLVIELKKSSSVEDEGFLDAMMRDPKFDYKYGCHILIADHKLAENWRRK